MYEAGKFSLRERKLDTHAHKILAISTVSALRYVTRLFKTVEIQQLSLDSDSVA